MMVAVWVVLVAVCATVKAALGTLLWNIVAAHFNLPATTFWITLAVVGLIDLLRPWDMRLKVKDQA